VAAVLVLVMAETARYLQRPPAGSLYVQEHFSPTALANVMIYGGTGYGVMFLGLIAALLVVDRLGRDWALGVVDLQRAAPLGTTRYVLGTFLGNCLAVLAPIAGAYLGCVATALLGGWPPDLLARFLLVYVPS